MGVQTPELVIENILCHVPAKGRISTRLISSAWNSVVMTRFLNEQYRVILRGMSDFKSFLEVFSQAKHGVPIKRYILSPSVATEEDFREFAVLIGPYIIELTVDCFDTDSGVSWGRRQWQTATRPKPNFDTGVKFFKRIDQLFQHTSNLEYFGINRLPLSALQGPPIDSTPVDHLSKLRIFARVPAARYSAWCDALVEHAPLLQRAKKVQVDRSLIDGRNFNLTRPRIVNGFPLSNGSTLEINTTKDLKRFNKNLKKEAQYQMLMRILYIPSYLEKKDFRLPFHPLFGITDLYYEEVSRANPTLYIHTGQFPTLRRLYINVTSNGQGGYPFQSCILPTVQDLTLALRLNSCEGWNLRGIFPNLRKLTIYFRIVPPRFQIRDLLHTFHGSELLETLVLEDFYRKNNTHVHPPTIWVELFGLGKNHICEHKKILVQTTCAIPSCEGGQALVFPALKYIDFDNLVLDEFLPLFIRSIRHQNFPALAKLSLGGYVSNEYCPTEVPNVEDYKLILESMVNDFKLEIRI